MGKPIEGKRSTTERFPVKAMKFVNGEFSKEDTNCVLLRQEVLLSTYYPRRQINNNLKGNPFQFSEFQIEELKFESTTYRYTLIEIPLEKTLEDVNTQLAVYPEAVLYRILSNHPILSDHQEYALESDLITQEQLANSQLLREGEKKRLALDKFGKPQYRGVYYSRTKVEDEDRRTPDVKDYYTYYELEEEINNIVIRTPHKVL